MSRTRQSPRGQVRVGGGRQLARQPDEAPRPTAAGPATFRLVIGQCCRACWMNERATHHSSGSRPPAGPIVGFICQPHLVGFQTVAVKLRSAERCSESEELSRPLWLCLVACASPGEPTRAHRQINHFAAQERLPASKTEATRTTVHLGAMDYPTGAPRDQSISARQPGALAK